MTMTNPRTNSASGAVTYDEGLRNHFRSVYNVMALGLLLTGLVALGVATAATSIPAFGNFMFGTPFYLVLAFAPLAFVFFGFSRRAVMNKSAGQLKTLFFLFSGVFGASLSAIFMVYAAGDIVRAFFITSATFAAMSIYGYTTKADLSKLGSFLFMGVIGLLIAIVVNMFLQSTMMDFIISCAGVLIYTLLTAFDTQNIKESYSASHGNDANNKMAVMGALGLYINFIMLFQFILNLMGGRSE